MTIYVDAMGGDLAPEAPVKGALKALRQYPHLTIILAGKMDEIKPFLGSYDDVKDRLILEEEPEIITNHESPVMGVRKKVNSATVQGMLKVRSGEADGFVSAPIHSSCSGKVKAIEKRRVLGGGIVEGAHAQRQGPFPAH